MVQLHKQVLKRIAQWSRREYPDYVMIYLEKMAKETTL